MKLSGRNAIITGASQGLGRVIAEHFLREGANVVLCARSEADLNKTRDELAQWLGVLPRDLSSMMTELASINAVRREKRGREVRYFMNSTIATHLPGQAARQAARDADGPLLVVMQGGKNQDRSD